MNSSFGHAPSAARIDVSGLAKTYPSPGKDVLAIQNIDLVVEAGEFVTILGPSGCGKSSLLNILAGFEQATGGVALIGGKEIRGPRHGQGVVFQDTAALFPWLSVHDNVAFGLMNTRLTRSERDAKVRAALAMVGLEQFGSNWPHQLSGGMRQLASIARVLVTECSVLLMDEPFAALDALTRQQMQQKLLHIWQATGISIVLITHSIDEAIYLGNRVYILTRRPAEVAAELTVDLTYPRDVTDRAFNRLKSVALKTLGL